jgi:hypothetical protein
MFTFCFSHAASLSAHLATLPSFSGVSLFSEIPFKLCLYGSRKRSLSVELSNVRPIVPTREQAFARSSGWNLFASLTRMDRKTSAPVVVAGGAEVEEEEEEGFGWPSAVSVVTDACCCG